jgi:uncharacterized membrane protein
LVKKTSSAHKSGLAGYFQSYNFSGVILGAVFVYLSFLPSLLPRGMILQGVVSAVLFMNGYAIGVIISHFVRKFDPAFLKTKKRHHIKKYTYWILAVLYVLAAVLGYVWQKEARQLVGQPADNSVSLLVITLVGLLIAAFLLLVARSIRSLYGWLKRLINKHIPRPIAYASAWIITVLVVIGILNGVILSGAMSLLNQAYSVKNGTTEEGIVQPTDSHLSGSGQSLIAWNTLGRQGRNFIGRAPTTKQLTSFNQAPATQPIRIYSGLESASSIKDRADLAVADLKRAGGFDRKIVVVVTTTGTGWVDEEGVKPVEYMYNGDSAIVSMQYSYLPSSLSFLVDQQKAKDAGSQLYNAVYNEALNMPKEQRPKVVVFGESLGSYGGEAAFANEASFRTTSDGAVWAGPPNFNILRKTASANRDAGSPEILPVFQNGNILRFARVPADLKNPNKPWGYPKAVYLENSSDPIVWWSPALMYREPDWLNEPRGADVSSKTRWIPIVTFWEVSGDMVFSTGVPDGHGHKYGKMPTDAWSYVAPSDGWTQQKTDSLKAELSK